MKSNYFYAESYIANNNLTATYFELLDSFSFEMDSNMNYGPNRAHGPFRSYWSKDEK